MVAATLYRERRLSVGAIAGQLRVSKSTLYSYLRHRGVEIGPYKRPTEKSEPLWPGKPAPDTNDEIRTGLSRVWGDQAAIASG